MRFSVLSRGAFPTVAFMDRCGLEVIRRLCEAEVEVKLLASTEVKDDILDELSRTCARVRV
jgi:hypothetical protein